MKGKRELALLAAAALLFLGGGFYYIYGYHWKEWQRQKTETELAVRYLEQLAARDWPEEETEQYPEYWMNEDWEEDAPSSWLTREENIWYREDGADYTPEYGSGVIQCVLEVPSAGILRGVYAGSWEELADNINQWMLTAARPDYVPGRTHMCIYGRSQAGLGLAFGALDQVGIGEPFYLTCESGRYEYQVTNIFSVSRETATEVYVDDFYLPKEMCYLITNGKGANRNEDIIVEGMLQRRWTLAEWVGS